MPALRPGKGRLSLDTETSGIDLYHGSKPFIVTTCTEQDDQRWWEWDVDPLTRQVRIPREDIKAIRRLLDEYDWRVSWQNGKFDAHALVAGEIVTPDEAYRLLERCDDTIIAGHLLDSASPHNITDMAFQHLSHDMEHLEKAVQDAVTKARGIVGRKLPTWRIAKAGMPELPSVNGGSKRDDDKPWKNDMWLPRALCKWASEQVKTNEEDWWWEYAEPDHPWWTVTSAYANEDSAVVPHLLKAMLEKIEARGFTRIYRKSLKKLPPTFLIEHRGVTYSQKRLVKMRDNFVSEAERSANLCVGLAKGLGHDLILPKSGNNKSLTTFVFDVLKLPPVGQSKKTGAPSLNADAFARYETELPERSQAAVFLRALGNKRKRDTAVSYMDGYERFGIKLRGWEEWRLLHSNLNPTGAKTLRFTSFNPNSQNLSKKEGFNLRYCFGPAPGREWWVMDGENLELRLPVYEAGEEAMIALFERPNDPPYFGSNHLLVSHILHPKLFEECINEELGCVDGRIFKDRHPLWYRRVKSGSFAVTCGAVKRADGWGTADKAYGIQHAQARVEDRMTKMAALSARLLAFANEHGYVETMPDRTVDPSHGYPIVAMMSKWGDVVPTKPFSNHIQGTAMWWMCSCMEKTTNQLIEWRDDGFDAFITLQVHDELVFDFPFAPDKGNLPRAERLRSLMESCGDDIGVPTTVSVEYCQFTYDKGEKIKRCPTKPTLPTTKENTSVMSKPRFSPK